MKRTVFSVFTSLAAIVFLGACEQHSWEDTKHLTQPHGDHATHANGDDHDGHSAHTKEAATPEKEEHH